MLLSIADNISLTVNLSVKIVVQLWWK